MNIIRRYMINPFPFISFTITIFFLISVHKSDSQCESLFLFVSFVTNNIFFFAWSVARFYCVFITVTWYSGSCHIDRSHDAFLKSRRSSPRRSRSRRSLDLLTFCYQKAITWWFKWRGFSRAISTSGSVWILTTKIVHSHSWPNSAANLRASLANFKFPRIVCKNLVSRFSERTRFLVEGFFCN